MNDAECFPTRPSLLRRLKYADDQQSWRDFCLLFRKRIHSTATRAGFSNAEAQDIVQEAFIIVFRKIAGFHYDPARGSFKSWLSLITRRRIEKQLKKRLPSHPSDDSSGTSAIDRLPAQNSFEAAWNAEWEKTLWTTALDRLKARLKPKQFQMFDLDALKEWPIEEVARALGVSATHVYVNKHRVVSALRRELTCLRINPL